MTEAEYRLVMDDINSGVHLDEKLIYRKEIAMTAGETLKTGTSKMSLRTRRTIDIVDDL